MKHRFPGLFPGLLPWALFALMTPLLDAQTTAAPPAPPPPAAAANKAEEIAARIEKEVEKVRGLVFKEPVKIGVHDPDSLRKVLLKLAEKDLSPEKIGPYERGLKALALLPPDLDLKTMLLNVLNEQIGGFYDPDAKELRLIDRTKDPAASSRPQMPLGKDITEDEVIMAHELTHALQDQHFGLKKLPIEVEDDDDLVTAVKALVEGDATVLMMAWVLDKQGSDTETIFSPMVAGVMEMALGKDAIPGAEVLSAAPEVLKEGLMFPYVGGFKFCATIARDAKTFVPIDAAFRNPPLSTEQVLHPKKYGGNAPDYPMAVTLPDLSKDLGMTRVTTNTLGELYTRVLLAEKIKKPEARRAAAGWDGDRYALYGKEGAPDALVWLSTWDAIEEADEFEAALKTWLAALHPDVKSEDSDVTTARFVRPGDVVDAIARKGADVILLRGIPREHLIATLRRLMEDTTKAERTKVP